MTEYKVKSCIQTIELLRRLAYNVHGVIDVIDDENCNTIIKLLKENQAPVEPFRKDDYHYYCGVCGLRLSSKKKQRFCHECGRAVDWND